MTVGIRKDAPCLLSGTNNVQAPGWAAAALWTHVSRAGEQSVCSVLEKYRVSLSACPKHPGSEAMTAEIRYVSPITQTVCKERGVLRQGK